MKVQILIVCLLGFCAGQQKSIGCPQQDVIVPCRCLLRDKEYQIWCSHSDFPRVLEGLKAVGKHIFRPIDELILENNNLPSLPGKAFIPLKVMRLMLRNNNLERVADGWLSGLETSLMELFIVEPELRGLPEESLREMNVLEAVTIRTNLMKRLPRFSSLSRLRHLQIESQSLLELSPRHFANLPKLEKVHIGGSPRLQRLEAGLFQDLPLLRLLNVSNCGLEWMHLRSVTRLQSLNELVLVGNKIRDAGMVGRGVRGLPQLEVLRLDSNEIERLSEADFVDLPSLKRLYLSGNRIQELHHGAFHRVPNLRMLDLNYNRVRRVHPESFLQHSASGLEELWLMNNDLTYVAELRSLLDALPRLTFLDMSYNNLEAIPFGALRGHPTLEHLNLDYNKVQIIEADAFMAMPALRELRLKNNSLSDHLEFPLWKLPSLKGLDLSGNFFTRLDTRLLTNVPSLRKIDLSGNELMSIDPEIFLLTPELESINLSKNSLPSMHPATFRHLAKLFELDLSQNNLPEFMAGLPKNIEYLHLKRNLLTDVPQHLDLPALKMLDISSNSIQRLPLDSFRKLPQLKKLYLAKNALHQIDQNSFPGLNRLEVLDLRDNRISKVPPDTFKDCPVLTELNLRDNRLEMLVPEVFRGCNNLKVLDVSRNQLTEFIHGALGNVGELEVMRASHNSLVNLPQDFYELKNLKVLDLSNNRLKDLRNLNTLKALVELRLGNNFIQDLRYGTFDGLPDLKLLELEDNEISGMETKALGNMGQLSAVKLNRNRLREIPSGAFAELPKLQLVELQENELKLVSNAAFYKVPAILMLNLSGNHLDSLENCGLRGLRSLEMLDLSRNEIISIEGRSLERMEWLVELRMDDNKICSVNGATTFNEMPRLRVLSLRNNRMMTFPEGAVQKLRGNLAVLDIDGNPLACSCSILWLRFWLQEQSTLGPKCSDGSLLRDIRLSRQECSEAKTTSNEILDSGCEGVEETSQIFAQQHWMNRTNIDKNHLAPSPEESEYFYDEYIDEYPYNETSSSTTNRPKSHFASGDTPVIYAATRNKTKSPHDTPKGVIGSPSSSGFTFFGLPLPSLSLNNFLGNMRMDDKPKSVEAERKAAIVNKPTFYKEMTRKPMDLPERRPIIGMTPPTHPILHTGFVPLLPGSGGFTPMIIPEESIKKNFTAHIEKVNLTQSISQSASISTQIDPTNYPQNSPSFLTKRGPIIPTTTSTTQKPITEEIRRETTTIFNDDYSEEEIEEELDNVDTTARIIKVENTSKPFTTTTIVTTTTIKPPDLETAQDVDGFGDIFKEVIENVSVPPEIPIVTTQTSTHIENLLKTQTKATPLSALLVPGGQQPQFRPSGRPIITKVVNPHASQQLERDIDVNNDNEDDDDIEDFITPLAHNREAKNGIFEAETKPDPKEPLDDVNNSWYFANYNKTNLEPYVGNGNWQKNSSCQRPIITAIILILTNFCLINV